MPHLPQTVLVAPDSFKGTLTAEQVAAAVAGGLEAAGVPTERCPIADGGEGTLEALLSAFGAEQRVARVHDPLGREIRARFGLANDVAIVETASGSGLNLLEPDEREPLSASTRGTGELIVVAVEAGAKTVYLGVGGSATTDGGAGAIDAIGAAGGLSGARLVVLCDVRTPFEDAARTFAPQKGADVQQVARLTKRLHALARRYDRDPRGVPMTGAAGGLSGGLWAQLGAQLTAGAPFVLNALDFDRRARASRAVITGEGKLDLQSMAGKALYEVATRARQSGVPCHAVVGANELSRFDLRILDLQAVLLAGTEKQLRTAGARLAELI